MPENSFQCWNPAPMVSLPRTTAIVQQGIADKLHLGCQLYIFRNGQVLADAAYGESRPGATFTPETISLWLSAVKPITAVAIAQLVERGQLALDTPVCQYIPEFGTLGKERISVRHLLTHTAGFRKPLDNFPFSNTPLEPGWVPGEKAGYHIASSWTVLGELVQRLTDRPYADYVRQQIFRPLGMEDSWLGIPPEEMLRYSERIGWAFLREDNRLIPHPEYNLPESVSACLPASNGRGPIHDLGRFYERLLKLWQTRAAQSEQPIPFLKPETVRLFTSRQRAGLYDHTFMHKMDWGFGFMVNSNRYGPETVPYGFGRHASEDAFGHSGSQSSCAFADPAHTLVISWVFNGLPGERLHQKRARVVNSAIYEDLALA